MALESILGALGTGIGAGAGAGLGSGFSQLFDILSAPRRALIGGLGSATGLWEGESADDVLRAAGMDTDSWLAKALGFGVETLLDPLTYAGMIPGGLLGRMGGRALGAIGDTAAARLAGTAGLADEVAALERARDAARAALAARVPPPTAAPEIMSHIGATYRPEIVAQLPESFADYARFAAKGGPSYKRFDPAMATSLDEMGLGRVGPTGSLQFDVPVKPGFVRGTGGYMKPTADFPVGSPLQEMGGGPIDLEMFTPATRYRMQLAQTGLTGPSPVLPPMPTLAQALGKDAAEMFAAQFPKAYVPVTESLGGTLTRNVNRHLLEQPLESSIPGIEELLNATRARLAAANAPLSPLEEKLIALGLGTGVYSGSLTGALRR